MDPTGADIANFSASHPLTPPLAPPNTRAAGSPIVGSPDFQPLRTEQLFPQGSGATISRPDSPFPFFRRISNGSQHGLRSTQSSPSLQYLSPPTIDSGGETPPYKPDQDDYFSLNMLVHRRKRKTGLRYSDRTGSRDTSESGSTPLLPINETRSRSPDALSLREFVMMNDRGAALDSALQTPRKTTQKSPEQYATEKSLVPAVGQRRPHFFLNTRVSSDPASSNLLASSDAREFKSGESSPEYDSMIRVWSTRYSSKKRRKNNASEGSRSSKGKGRSTGKLETPATIMLRKASVLCGATFAVTEHGLQTPGASARLLSDLQAATPTPKDSSQNHTANPPGNHASPLERTSPLTQQGAASDGDADSRTNEKPGPKLERTKTAERLFATPSLARQSAVADPAITFADVHTAPRTFSISATSRKSSLSPLFQLRRKSAVHMLSRTSVHEVIWKVDDLPSGYSSDDAHSTPTPLSRRTTGAEGSEDDAASDSPVFTENLSTSPPTFTVPEMPRTVPLDNADGKHSRTPKSDHDLFGWSWNRRPSAADIKVKEDAANVSGRITSIDPSQEARLRKWSTAWRKKSIFIPKVDPFPSQQEQNPADWQKSLAANFNISQAGHTPYVGITPPTPNELATSLPSGDPSKRRRSSSFKSHPFAPARVAQESKMGCAIGSSSHKRRTSHETPQRRISQPGSDPSKAQSRNPSLLRRLSVMLLPSQEEFGPITVSAPCSRSADIPSQLTNMPGRVAGGFVPLTLTAEPAAEEACRHRVQESDGSRTDDTVSTYITEPLKLVSTPDARADCESCKKHPIAQRTVSVDWIG